MSKFKVGDKVVHKDSRREYKITNILGDRLKFEGYDYGYPMSAFEHVAASPKPKFNVGDKVKFNNNLRTFKVWDDKVHTVSEVRLAVDDIGHKIDDGYQIRLTDSDMEWNHESHLDAYVEPAISNVRVSNLFPGYYIGETKARSNVQYKAYYRDASTPEPKTVLQEAEDIINGQRQNDYGTPEDSFSAIAAYWSVYLATDISAHDVAILMSLLKIARMDENSPKRDSYVDLAGYASLAHRVAMKDA